MTDTSNELRFNGYYSPVSSKDISMLTGIKSSDLSNRKRNNADFPQDRNNEQGAPIYFYGDVMRWAFSHGIKINGKEVIYREIELLERESMNPTLNIAIVGRPGSRKSFTASYFLEDPVFMRQALCGEGTDYTQIPTKLVVDGSSPFFRCTVSEDLREKIPEELAQYINESVAIDPNSPDFQVAMRKITDWLRYLHNEEGMLDLDKKTSLELFGRPSLMSKHIMERTGKRVITITDYPGNAGDYTFDKLGRQDVVLIAMRKEGMQDFISSINDLAALIGTNPVIFSYGVQGSATDEEEYNEEFETGKDAMQAFEGGLIKAFDNDYIISSSINALHPTDHFLVLPAFNPRKLKGVEECYTSRLEDMIIKEFNSRITPDKVADVLGESGVEVSEILSFIDEALYVPKTQPVDVSSHKAAVDIFKNKKHARVKSQDDYRILEMVDSCSLDELTKARDRLKQYTVSNCKEPWKQVLVTYIYQTIDRTLKMFPGVGIGTHPWEDSPAVTMRACESIFAEDLYNALKDYAERTEYSYEERADITSKYRTTLSDNSILSKSWNCAVANPYTITSLKILLKSGLLESGCRVDREESDLIQGCVVAGLMFQAAVDIYTDILRGVNKYEGMDSVIDLVRARFEEAKNS